MSRRGKRAEKELQQWKQKINTASGSDFDELSKGYMQPQEMGENLMALASTLEPTKRHLDENPNKKFSFNDKGEKVRANSGRGRENSKTKGARKKERSLAFWDRL